MNYPIPLAALDDRLAWIGTSGSGKTYNATAGVEKLLASGARCVIVDPLGGLAPQGRRDAVCLQRRDLRWRAWGLATQRARSSLKAMGLIDYPTPGKILLTEAGAEKAEAPDAPTTRDELHRRVMSKLNGPQQRVLRPLLEAYPEQLPNDELAAKAGYSPVGGAYGNPRSSLKSLSLIEYPEKGIVRAADWLFP